MDELLSSTAESYVSHIDNCKKVFNCLFRLYKPTAMRLLDLENAKEAEKFLENMIVYHDLGKLTKAWQTRMRENRKKLPSHAPIGAAFLFKILPENLREPISFAVCIHHTDSGLIGWNLEAPDAQAILDGLVDINGKIIWHDSVKNLDDEYFPEKAKSLSIEDLREMSFKLRTWARGNNLKTNHQRRIQGLFCHHILKLCDVFSARAREDFTNNKISKMVEDIEKYVSSKFNLLNKNSECGRTLVKGVSNL